MLIVLTFCKGSVSKPDVEERLPVSERVKVLRYFTLFRSGRWWAAVACLRLSGGSI